MVQLTKATSQPTKNKTAPTETLFGTDKVTTTTTINGYAELILVNATGTLVRDRCTNVSFQIPGLDADFCKCPNCKDIASEGVWWVDDQMRSRMLNRKR